MIIHLPDFIDYTILRPDCLIEDVKRTCEEAIKYRFKGVCIPPYFVQEGGRILGDSGVKLITVAGFPMGYSTTPAKVEEIKKALNEGADEVDYVVNIAAIKNQNWNYLRSDLDSCVMATHLKGKVFKVIVEYGLLSADELKRVCDLCIEKDVNFVKTSTGFFGNGATPEMVTTLRKMLPDTIKIKASGGIRTKEQAIKLIEAGASRIGTSAAVAIIS